MPPYPTSPSANDSHAAHAYNAAGWITNVVNAKSSGVTITSHAYSYDAAGNRLTKLACATTTYTYDAADELTLEDAAGELTTHSYDENGNTLAWNAAGERTTLTWGYEDEVLVIHAPEHVPVTMTYNGDHMRRKRQDANAIINYLWDGAQAFIETQSQDATLARYTLAPFGYGDLVSQRRSNETRFYHFDAIGSTRALSDSAEAATDTYAYEAFGKRIATSGATTNPYQWIARLGYLGEGRLDGYLLRRRYYRYGTGRFVSRDPVPMPGTTEYAYAANNAARFTDPSGEIALGAIIAILVGIAAALAAAYAAYKFFCWARDFLKCLAAINRALDKAIKMRDETGPDTQARIRDMFDDPDWNTVKTLCPAWVTGNLAGGGPSPPKVPGAVIGR